MYVVVSQTFHFVGMNVCSPCWWVLNSAAGTELHAKSLTVGLLTSCVCKGVDGLRRHWFHVHNSRSLFLLTVATNLSYHINIFHL